MSLARTAIGSGLGYAAGGFTGGMVGSGILAGGKFNKTAAALKLFVNRDRARQAGQPIPMYGGGFEPGSGSTPTTAQPAATTPASGASGLIGSFMNFNPEQLRAKIASQTPQGGMYELPEGEFSPVAFAHLKRMGIPFRFRGQTYGSGGVANAMAAAPPVGTQGTQQGQSVGQTPVQAAPQAGGGSYASPFMAGGGSVHGLPYIMNGVL